MNDEILQQQLDTISSTIDRLQPFDTSLNGLARQLKLQFEALVIELERRDYEKALEAAYEEADAYSGH